MKISVITVCHDAADTLEDTILSVSGQSFGNVEHIIVDGGSKDGVLNIIQKYDALITRWVSEPDEGIYDAMNKGIKMATGDVIGFLNADDIYAHPDVLTQVSEVMNKGDIQACFSDVVFVRDDMHTVVRYYCSRRFSPDKLAYGWMPAHPTLFLNRSLYEQYGMFKTDYQIAADYELVVRLLGAHGVPYKYLPGVSVKMRMGGVSTKSIRSNIVLSKEIVRACRENGINTSFPRVLLKYPLKILERFIRPS